MGPAVLIGNFETDASLRGPQWNRCFASVPLATPDGNNRIRDRAAWRIYCVDDLDHFYPLHAFELEHTLKQSMPDATLATCRSENCLRQLAHLVGAQALVSGKISKLADGYRLEVNLVHTTGTTQATHLAAIYRDDLQLLKGAPVLLQRLLDAPIPPLVAISPTPLPKGNPGCGFVAPLAVTSAQAVPFHWAMNALDPSGPFALTLQAVPLDPRQGAAQYLTGHGTWVAHEVPYSEEKKGIGAFDLPAGVSAARLIARCGPAAQRYGYALSAIVVASQPTLAVTTSTRTFKPGVIDFSAVLAPGLSGSAGALRVWAALQTDRGEIVDDSLTVGTKPADLGDGTEVTLSRQLLTAGNYVLVLTLRGAQDQVLETVRFPFAVKVEPPSTMRP